MEVQSALRDNRGRRKERTSISPAGAHADVPDEARLNQLVKSLHLHSLMSGKFMPRVVRSALSAHRLFDRRIVIEAMAYQI